MKSYIVQATKSLIENRNLTIVLAMTLAVMPFLAWAAMTVVALVTLRKGYNQGGLVALAVSFVLLAGGLTRLSFEGAILNTSLTVIPGYFLAACLRKTMRWHQTVILGLLMVFLGSLTIHLFLPEFINAQYKMFKALISNISKDTDLYDVFNSSSPVTQGLVANGLLGLQLLAALLSALTTLIFARWLQSLAFYPGAFQQEMLNFRADKPWVALFFVVMLGAWTKNGLAISLVPAIMFYLGFAGVSLAYFMLAPRQPTLKFVVLIVPVALIPYLVMPCYLVLGVLDSLFNFRLYLQKTADKQMRG